MSSAKLLSPCLSRRKTKRRRASRNRSLTFLSYRTSSKLTSRVQMRSRHRSSAKLSHSLTWKWISPRRISTIQMALSSTMNNGSLSSITTPSMTRSPSPSCCASNINTRPTGTSSSCRSLARRRLAPVTMRTSAREWKAFGNDWRYYCCLADPHIKIF